MTRRLVTRRLREEGGMTIIEALVAALVLSVGIGGMLGAFNGASKLSLTAERRASVSHLAQREIERLQAVPYEELSMISAPVKSSEEADPDYYVNYSAPGKCTEVEKGGCYAWNAENTAEEEPIAVASSGTKCPTTGTAPKGCGVVSSSPTEECSKLDPFGSCHWSDGRLSGDIYDFVTWHYDTVCKQVVGGENRCTEQSYKRISVVVTVNVSAGNHAVTPVRVSTLVADPKSVKPDPLASPSTTCGEPAKECTSGIGRGNARSWFLHDSGAESDEKVAEVPVPSKNNTETDPTVAPSKSEPCTKTNYQHCPRPDFMDATSPSATTLYDYSSDQDTYGYTYGTGERRGRRLQRGAECSLEPTSTEEGANFKNEMWVTEPLSEETKLTAAGGLSIYAQTIGGLSGEKVTLCLALYRVPSAIQDLWSKENTEEPERLAYTSYTPEKCTTTYVSGKATATCVEEWPGSMQAVSFVFEPGKAHALISAATGLAIKTGETLAIPAKDRIGLRIWPAGGSMSDISIAYDTAAQPALLQLNTE